MISFRALEEVVVDVHSSDKVCLDKEMNKYCYLGNQSLLHMFCKRQSFPVPWSTKFPSLVMHGSSFPLSTLSKRSVAEEYDRSLWQDLLEPMPCRAELRCLGVGNLPVCIWWWW